MKKQTLIIIIIAAAAAYVLYRRGVFSSAPATVGGTTDPDPSPVGGYGTDKTDTDSITDALSLTATDRRKVKDMACHISKCVSTTTGGWNRSSILDKAADNGVTFEQQIVIEALWQVLVYPINTSNRNEYAKAKARFDTLQTEVKHI